MIESGNCFRQLVYQDAASCHLSDLIADHVVLGGHAHEEIASDFKHRYTARSSANRRRPRNTMEQTDLAEISGWSDIR